MSSAPQKNISFPGGGETANEALNKRKYSYIGLRTYLIRDKYLIVEFNDTDIGMKYYVWSN